MSPKLPLQLNDEVLATNEDATKNRCWYLNKTFQTVPDGILKKK